MKPSPEIFAKLSVDLGERSYPIVIGKHLLEHTEFSDYVPGKRVAIVTNTTVAPLYLERLTGMLTAAGKQCIPIVLADGEEEKNAANLMRVFDVLLETKCDRKTTLVALGGGVIGDLTGFAAATYMRGVPFVQIPTTLLAQVDSSVGGKTAINHPLGKNMIGAFYQPQSVIADTSTLMTLPARELSAGLAEVIKHGAIIDAEFFGWQEKNMAKLMARDDQALAYAIQRSCEIKADVVRQDERETGLRAILNFGHTFGHAIENGFGYGKWLHGEAFPTQEKLLRLSRILQVSPAWLRFGQTYELHEPGPYIPPLKSDELALVEHWRLLGPSQRRAVRLLVGQLLKSSN